MSINQNKWESIQALRGAAAGMVVIGHLLLSGGPKPDWMAFIIERVTTPSAHAGVDLFFCISGAVMYLVTRHAQGGRQAASAFLIRRALRIYPVFWIALLAMMAINDSQFYSVQTALAQITLYDFPPILSVAWTLTMEIRFYLIVGAVLWLSLPGTSARRFPLIALIICSIVIFGQLDMIPKDMATNLTMLEFLGGAAVAALVTRTDRFALTAILTGLLGFSAAVVLVWPGGRWVEDVSPYRVLIFGMPSALVLYGSMALERSRRATPPKWLVRMGDASYSIYIWHLPVIVLVWTQWPKDHFDLYAYFAVVLATVGAVATVSWHLIERPAQRLAAPRPLIRSGPSSSENTAASCQ
ncbi:hypothetical protein ASD80_05265 [Devosia sp. Root635]|nr:hypothetical protein ASD80_05265 [Devosia sp. Root635]